SIAVRELRHGGEKAVSLLISLLRHPKDRIRLSAVEALRDMGSQARAATPYLLAMIEEHGATVIAALAAIGDEDAIPKLTQLLDDPKLGQSAIEALMSFGPQAKSATPKLHALLTDPQENQHRVMILTALLQIDPDDEKALDLLAEWAMNGTGEERRHV